MLTKPSRLKIIGPPPKFHGLGDILQVARVLPKVQMIFNVVVLTRVSQFLLIMFRRRPRRRGRPGFLAGWPAQGMSREIWRR
jgi:hypothetical protein